MAAAVIKSVAMFTKAAMLLLLVASALSHSAQAQGNNCAAQLNTLNVCTPFLMPGAGSPSADCCGALRAVPRDCVCSTLRISASLPSSCSIPPLDCGN